MLTNVASCMYPKDLDELPVAAIEACRPRLEHELAEAKVKTVIAMGNSAIKGVMDPKTARRGVTKLRVGPVKPATAISGGSESDASKILSVSGVSGTPQLLADTGTGIQVAPTFHPAACLRNQQSFPMLVTDVGKALAVDPPTLWFEPKTIVLDDVHPTKVDDAIREITRLNRGQGLVVDIENAKEKDETFGNLHLNELLCIGIGPLDPQFQDTVFVFTPEAIAIRGEAIAEMVRECGIIAQNGKHDVSGLESALGIKGHELIFDTMLASYCLNEASGVHGLEYLGMEFLGTSDWKTQFKKTHVKDNDYGTAPTEALYEYNGRDVHATRLLYGYFSDQIESRGLTQIFKHLLRASNTIMHIELRGLGFDMAYSKTLSDRITGEQELLETQIPFNPRSWQQVKKYFSTLEPPINLPNTQEDTLVHFQSRMKPDSTPRLMIDKILKSRGYTKMLGTYIVGLQTKITPAGTVHPSFLLHSTTTGRLSSRKPNAQNIPRAKELKRQFIPSIEGNVFVQCDYSQAELRVLAWLAREDNLRDLFNDKTKDVFYTLCQQMLPKFDAMNAVEKKEARTLIKTFAYGVSYGRTAHGIAGDPAFGVDIAQAQSFMDMFTQGIPKIMEFQARIKEQIKSGVDLVNPFGRHRRFYLITDQNRDSLENEAMAFLPQSTASDICVEAASRLTGDGIDIRNLVHDAILAEASPSDAEEVMRQMQFRMAEVGNEIVDGYIRFDTDGAIGSSWDQV